MTSPRPRILLIIKSPDFTTVRTTAHIRGIPVFDLAHNGGNLGEIRAITGADHFPKVQRWFHEDGVCSPGTGYPPGTLLYFRLDQ